MCECTSIRAKNRRANLLARLDFATHDLPLTTLYVDSLLDYQLTVDDLTAHMNLVTRSNPLTLGEFKCDVTSGFHNTLSAAKETTFDVDVTHDVKISILHVAAYLQIPFHCDLESCSNVSIDSYRTFCRDVSNVVINITPYGRHIRDRDFAVSILDRPAGSG